MQNRTFPQGHSVRRCRSEYLFEKMPTFIFPDFGARSSLPDGSFTLLVLSMLFLDSFLGFCAPNFNPRFCVRREGGVAGFFLEKIMKCCQINVAVGNRNTIFRSSSAFLVFFDEYEAHFKIWKARKVLRDSSRTRVHRRRLFLLELKRKIIYDTENTKRIDFGFV